MTGAAPTIEGTSFDGPAFSREEIGAYKICDASISDRGVARREVSDPESEMMQLPVDDPPGARTRWETFSGKIATGRELNRHAAVPQRLQKRRRANGEGRFCCRMDSAGRARSLDITCPVT